MRVASVSSASLGMRWIPNAIGDKAFIDEIEQEIKEQRQATKSPADIVWPRVVQPDIEVVEQAVADEFGIDIDDLGMHGRRVGPAKSVAVEFACRLCGLTQRAAGERYGGISGAAAAHLRKALRAASSKDEALRKRVDELAEKMRDR